MEIKKRCPLCNQEMEEAIVISRDRPILVKQCVSKHYSYMIKEV